MLLMILQSILLILMGSFMVGFTTFFWELTAKWMSNNADEPSDLYLLNTRIGGTISLVVGVVGLVASFFLDFG